MQESVVQSPVKRVLFVLIFLTLILPAVYLRVNNTIKFRASEGYDSTWHMRTIIYYMKYHTFPDLTDNLEAYQPPLYYVISALLLKSASLAGIAKPVKILQCFTMLLGFVMVYYAYKLYVILFRKALIPVFFLVGFMLYLPVHVYRSTMIGNEMLSHALICCAIYYAARVFLSQEYTIRKSLFIGTVLGCALLTKYTALTIVPSLFFTLCFAAYRHRAHRNRIVVFTSVWIGVMALIAGWWYVRNMMQYGDPFITSIDTPKFAQLYKNQPPGAHGLKNCFAFDPNIFQQPFIAQNARFDEFYSQYYKGMVELYNTSYNSIPAGTYATIWIENHGSFVTLSRESYLYLARFLMGLSILPMAAVVVGLYLLIKNLFRTCNITLLFLLMTMFMGILFYMAFNIQHPYFAHIKFSFIMYMMLPLSIAFGLCGDYLFRKSYSLFALYCFTNMITAAAVFRLYQL